MTFVVVKVDQLKEHANIESATAEAARLTRKHNGEFYVAELVRKTVLQIEFAHPPFMRPNDTTNNGRRWSELEDENLIERWISGKYTVTRIAELHQRTPFAIQCRLERFGFDPYSYTFYKG